MSTKTKSPLHTTIIIEDSQGKTKIEIQNNCSQMRIENENGSVYFNTCGDELLLIAATLERIVDKQFPNHIK
jgi:hypothetical protein